MAKCSYTAPDGQMCSRTPVQGQQYCQYHLERDHPSKPISAMFASDVRVLLGKGDGQLKGFIFPRSFKLRDLERKKLDICCDVNLSYADFFDTDLSNITFHKEVTARQIKAYGYFNLITCDFYEQADFTLSNFEQEFFCNSNYRSTSSFKLCNFNGRTTYNGSFNGKAIFTDSVFFDSATFLGGRSISIVASGVMASTASSVIGFTTTNATDKKLWRRIVDKWKAFQSFITGVWSSYKQSALSSLKSLWAQSCNKLKKNLMNLKADWLGKYDDPHATIKILFNAEVDMNGIDFHRPERIRLICVNMRKARVIGTDFHGVQFYDTDWDQPKLRRKGLYEEVEIRNTDIGTKIYKRPQLEQAYRNVRTALEMSKDYDTASDFYIGERDSHRLRLHPLKRHIFSIDAWYNSISRYGTSPGRAIRIIVWLVILHLSFELYAFKGDLSELYANSGYYFPHLLEIFTMQKPTVHSWTVGWWDLSYRFVAAIMLGLTALSFRARIKRH